MLKMGDYMTQSKIEGDFIFTNSITFKGMNGKEIIEDTSNTVIHKNSIIDGISKK